VEGGEEEAEEVEARGAMRASAGEMGETIKLVLCTRPLLLLLLVREEVV
jgi:hypothetical protein